MIPVERRWAGPAAAVLVFCLTLVVTAPPTSPPLSTAVPASIVADGVAAMAAHAYLGLFALAGLYIGARALLQRPVVETQRVSTPSTQIHAA